MFKRKIVSVKKCIDKYKNVIIHGLPGTGKTRIALKMPGLFKVCVHFDCSTDYSFFEELYEAISKSNTNFSNLMMSYCGVDPLFEKDFLFVFDNIDASPYFAENIFPFFLKHDFKVLMTMRTKNQFLHSVINNSYIFVLYPVSFRDFFEKCDGGLPEDIITGHISMGKEVPNFIHNNCNRVLEDYLATGGMPESIITFFDSENLDEDIKFIHEKYRFYVLEKLFENADINDATKFQCRQICNSVLEQMLDGNYHKFVFNKIREGVSYRTYENAISFLVENHYLIRITDKTKKNCFKLFFYDCGILLEMLLHLSNKEMRHKEFKEITEVVYQNCLVQELKCNGYDIWYWKSQYTAVVDAVIEVKGKTFAFKVFPDDDLRDKSLDEFLKVYPDTYLFKLSQGNFVKSSKYFHLPFYAISCVELQKFGKLFLNVVE